MYPDPTGPQVGDPIPKFALPDTAGVLFLPRSPQMAGHLGLILVLGDPGAPPSRAFIDAAAEHLAALTARAGVIIAITGAADPAANLALAGANPPLPILADVEATARADFGRADGPPAVYLVDRNSFVIGVFDTGSPAAIMAAAATAAAAPDLHPEGQLARHQAPVIQLPNLLEPAFCRSLIALWATGNRDTGVAQPADARIAADATYDTLKSRRDHIIDDPDTLARFRRHFGLRLLPEIHKVFFYQVTKHEFLRIGRYDAADGGVFRPHRDTNPPNQQRRFALTINLNTGEYDGGALHFPEYSPDLFVPPAGAGVVFPCSLIHEVTPVTRGQRYAVVTFFF